MSELKKRRGVAPLWGGIAVLSLAALGGAWAAVAQETVAPITIVINQSPWFEGFANFIEMYQGGFLRPLAEIDPSFELDPGVYTFDDSVYWNPETNRVDPAAGQLMTVPINPNIPLLYYRTDLYEELGLEVPETWDELLENAKA